MAGSGTRGHHEPVPVLFGSCRPRNPGLRGDAAQRHGGSYLGQADRRQPTPPTCKAGRSARRAPGGSRDLVRCHVALAVERQHRWCGRGGAGGGAGSSSSSSSAPPRGRSDGRDPGLIRGTGSKEFGAARDRLKEDYGGARKEKISDLAAADSSGPAWENSNSRRRSTSPTRAVCPTWLRSRATPTPTCRCARLRSWATSKRRRGRRRRNPPPSSTRRRRRPGPERTR